MLESWARREARLCGATVCAAPASRVTSEPLVGWLSATSGPGGRVWGFRTDPSSARLLRVMLPFLMVIDMKRSSRERPWPVGVARGHGQGVSTISSDGPERAGPSEVRGQVSLTETTRSVVRLPGRATCATYGVRLDWRHWIQLPVPPPDAAL